MNSDSLNTEINDRTSFAKFLGELLESYHSNPSSWENRNIADFLEAMQRYTEDLQGYYDNIEPGKNADNPSWKVFADILRGASIYE